jgi:cytochrome c-type biogenesis protein CcmH
MRLLSLLSILGCLFMFTNAPAIDTPMEFDNPETELRFKKLTEELRCLVCQNQSLADSHAELAQDLRNEVYKMIIAGDTDKEIIDYLVVRYGDFVLYRPQVKSTTYFLWFGPFLILLIAIIIIARVIRPRDNDLAKENNEEGNDPI